jgi:hypothetical protein
VERDHLNGDVGLLGGLDEGDDLLAQDAGATDRAAQRGLVHDGPQLGRIAAGQQVLARHPQVDPAVDLLGAGGAVAEHDDRPGVVAGLQQAGHELHLVRADQRRGRLEPEVGGEPGRRHVAVPVPPAGVVGLPGQREQGGALAVLPDAVEGEQVGDVALLEADAAQLHPADLRLRGADLPAGGLAGDPLALSELA